MSGHQNGEAKLISFLYSFTHCVYLDISLILSDIRYSRNSSLDQVLNLWVQAYTPVSWDSHLSRFCNCTTYSMFTSSFPVCVPQLLVPWKLCFCESRLFFTFQIFMKQNIELFAQTTENLEAQFNLYALLVIWKQYHQIDWVILSLRDKKNKQTNSRGLRALMCQEWNNPSFIKSQMMC